MEDFSRRSTTPEWMDAPCGYETFRGCLQDLARANAVTLTHRPTLAFLDGLRRRGVIAPGKTVHIVDVGSGYGDLLRAIDRWSQPWGLTLSLTGVDLNPWSAKAASEATDADRPIGWSTTDVFDYDQPCDLVLSSLFTHHLTDDEIVRFVRWMEGRARLGWFINDLHRHPLSYYGFGLLAGLMRWHPFVRHDGPVSIARAFTVHEWRDLLSRSGMAQRAAEVKRRFPFRICVSRVR